MDLEGIYTNPQEQIRERGVLLIDNPNKEEEFPLVAVNEREVVERWYWLIYQGSTPDGWRCPENRTESTWRPEHSCWREATEEDMKVITDAIRNDKAKHYKTITEKFKMASGEETKGRASYIELPMSKTFIIQEHNMIVRKWRDTFNWDNLGYGPELEERSIKIQKLSECIRNTTKCIGEYKIE